MRTRQSFPGYDAILDTDRRDMLGHGSITLLVRVCVQQYRIPSGHTRTQVVDGEHVARDIVARTPEDWRRWVSSYPTAVQAGWNDKLWLVRRGRRVCAPRRGADLFPALRCTLSVRLVSEPSHGHATFQVVRPVGRFASSTHPAGRSLAPTIAQAILGFDDVALVRTGEAFKQVGAVHEMGHYLGLLHVAEGRADPYGETFYESGSVMGRGMDVRRAHAWPWTHRLWQMGFRGPNREWDVYTQPPPSHLASLPRRRVGRGPW